MFSLLCTSTVFAFGIQFLIAASANAHISRVSEENTQEPVHQLNRDTNNARRNNLYKRQINQQLRPFSQSQFFPPPFDSEEPNVNNPTDQFTGQQFQDEEERFFSSGERATTLNPLAFINPPPSTLNPLEQQLANEQRRFQQEIADKGLREQEQRSLGIARPQPLATDLNSLMHLLQSPSSPLPETPTSIPFFSADDSLQNYEQPQSYINIRNYRSHYRRQRSIDRQLVSANEVGSSFPSTTLGSRPYLNAILQNPEPRNDLAKIGNWLIQRLAKQLQQNIAHLADPTPRPYTPRSIKPSYSTTPKYVHSTELPQNLVTFSYPESAARQESKANWFRGFQTTPKTNNFEWSNTAAPISDTIPKFESMKVPVVINSPVQYLENTYKMDTSTPTYLSMQNAITPSTFLVQPTTTAETPKLELQNPTYPVFQTSSSTGTYHKPSKIKNLQILSSHTLNPNLVFVSPYENSLDAYKPVYEVDQTSVTPPESATASSLTTAPSSTEDGATVTSLFKTKINEFKDVEVKSRSTESPSTNFQQPNWLFDQLQQLPNSSFNFQLNKDPFVNVTPIYSGQNGKTAIFIKLPPEDPTSTVGYIFDKTISAKTSYKKENLPTKKNNRSPQIIKSSLVYRTPPGKRASISRLETIQNNQVDSTIASNYREIDKPVQWLLGNSRTTTTNRPFVTALWNLIQNRSPG